MRSALSLLFFIAVLVSTSCQQKDSREHHHDANNSSQDSSNQELYEQVMAVHDEVMPKMNDLHKAKTSLQTRLALPGVAENEKQEIERKIARIDSASEGMMVWMRQFNPLPDSVGEEKARAYLESELVKVNKVKQDILDALQAAATTN